MADKTLNDVVRELSDIKTIVAGTQEALDNNTNNIKDGILASFKSIKLSATMKGIKSGLVGLKGSFSSSIDTLRLQTMILGDSVKNSFRGMSDTFKLQLAFLGDSIKQGFSDFGNSVIGKITAPFKIIGEKFNSLKESIAAPFATIGNALKGVGNFFGNIGKGFMGLFKKKKDPNSNNHKLIEAGNKILKNISKGFTKFTEQLKVQAIRAKEGQREQLELFKNLGKSAPGAGGGDGKVPGGKGGGGGIFSKIGSAIGGTIGGIVNGIGNGFAKVGKKMKDVMAGALAIAAVGAALIPAAKAFQMFGDVTWKAVGAGIVVLGALVVAVMALGAIMSSGVGTIAILAGAAALGIIGLAMIPAAKAFQIFGKALNEHLMPALEKFGPIVNDFIDRLVISFGEMANVVSDFVGDTVDVLVSAFERGVDAVGGMITNIVGEIAKLGALDGENLLAVAAGITAVGGALLVFGATGSIGSIVGAIGESLSKLFGGGESPMDRLFKLADRSVSLDRAANAISTMGTAIRDLSRSVSNFKFNKNNGLHQYLTQLTNDLLLLPASSKVDAVTNLAEVQAAEGARMEARMSAQRDANAALSAAAATTIINNYYNTTSSSNASSVVYNTGGAIDEDLTPVY